MTPLIPSVGLSIRARFASSAETSENGSDVGNDRLISQLRASCPSASASASALILPRFFSFVISAIFPTSGWRAIPASRFLVFPRPLILPGLALIVCYEPEQLPIFDKLFNQGYKVSAFLGDMSMGFVERTELVSVLFLQVHVAEGERLLILWIPLDFHQHLVDGRIQWSPLVYRELIVLCWSGGFFRLGPLFFFLNLFILFVGIA